MKTSGYWKAAPHRLFSSFRAKSGTSWGLSGIAFITTSSRDAWLGAAQLLKSCTVRHKSVFWTIWLHIQKALKSHWICYFLRCCAKLRLEQSRKFYPLRALWYFKKTSSQYIKTSPKFFHSFEIGNTVTFEGFGLMFYLKEVKRELPRF